MTAMRKNARKTFLGYLLLATGILLANNVVLSFYTYMLGVSVWLAKILTEVTLFLISLTVQTTLIFKKDTYHKLQKTFDVQQVMQDGAYQSWTFGPNLLDENGKALSSFNTWDYIRQTHPRSAIGYYKPGHYCFVVVDGRQSGYSRGMTLPELARVFEDLGCSAAYNLDGGHSTFMTIGDQVVNRPYKPGHQIVDCLYFGEVA